MNSTPTTTDWQQVKWIRASIVGYKALLDDLDLSDWSVAYEVCLEIERLRRVLRDEHGIDAPV